MRAAVLAILCCCAAATHLAPATSLAVRIHSELHWCRNQTATCVQTACQKATIGAALPDACCAHVTTPVWDYMACKMQLSVQPYASLKLHACDEDHWARCDTVMMAKQMYDEFAALNAKLDELQRSQDERFATAEDKVQYAGHLASTLDRDVRGISTVLEDFRYSMQAMGLNVADIKRAQAVFEVAQAKRDILTTERDLALASNIANLDSHVAALYAETDKMIKYDDVKHFVGNITVAGGVALDTVTDWVWHSAIYALLLIAVAGTAFTCVLYACATCRWGHAPVKAPPAPVAAAPDPQATVPAPASPAPAVEQPVKPLLASPLPLEQRAALMRYALRSRR